VKSENRNPKTEGNPKAESRRMANLRLPISDGIQVVYGVKEPKPIVGAPPGRQRLCLRNNCAAELFVRTPDGIRLFILVERLDCWLVDLRLEHGRNYRPWTPGREGQ
jgi:hypothetical protein